MLLLLVPRRILGVTVDNGREYSRLRKEEMLNRVSWGKRTRKASRNDVKADCTTSAACVSTVEELASKDTVGRNFLDENNRDKDNSIIRILSSSSVLL